MDTVSFEFVLCKITKKNIFRTTTLLKQPLREIGAKLSLDPTILSKIEQDKRMPTKEQFKALADFYKDQKNEVIIA